MAKVHVVLFDGERVLGETELADIRAIFADHRRGPGFSKLHVGERVPGPLVGTAIRVAELARSPAARPTAWSSRWA